MRPRRSRDPSWGTAFGRGFCASINSRLLPCCSQLRISRLSPQERMSLANAAEELPAVEDRLRLVPEVAHRRYLRAPECGAARAPEGATRQEPQAQRGDSGLSVGQDYR